MKVIKMFSTWLVNLPTEFQFSFAICFMGQVSWVACMFSDNLKSELPGLLTFFSSLALGAIAHGAFSRSKAAQVDADKDLKGG